MVRDEIKGVKDKNEVSSNQLSLNAKYVRRKNSKPR